jgi:hypothetical protein
MIRIFEFEGALKYGLDITDSQILKGESTAS